MKLFESVLLRVLSTLHHPSKQKEKKPINICIYAPTRKCMDKKLFQKRVFDWTIVRCISIWTFLVVWLRQWGLCRSRDFVICLASVAVMWWLLLQKGYFSHFRICLSSCCIERMVTFSHRCLLVFLNKTVVMVAAPPPSLEFLRFDSFSFCSFLPWDWLEETYIQETKLLFSLISFWKKENILYS